MGVIVRFLLFVTYAQLTLYLKFCYNNKHEWFYLRVFMKKLLIAILLFTGSSIVCSSEKESSPLATLIESYKNHFVLDEEKPKSKYFIDRVILAYGPPAKGYLIVSIPDVNGRMGHQKQFRLDQEQETVDYLNEKWQEDNPNS